MATFTPYEGEIIPLDKEEEKAFTPYEGEIIPLEDENHPRLEEEIMQRQPMSDKRVGKASNLPVPTEDMYDGLEPDDALSLYEAYKKHPDTKTNWLGQSSYKDTPFLDPERTKINKGIQGTAKGLKPENIAGGLYNMGREAIRTTSAINETADNLIGELPENIQPVTRAAKSVLIPASGALTVGRDLTGLDTKTISETLPRFKAETPEGEIVSNITEIGSGFLIGSKINPQLASRVFNKIVQLGVESAVISGISDENQDLLLTGDKASFMELVPGLGIDPNGKYSDELMKKRMNAFIDAYIVAKGGELAGSAAMGIAKGSKSLVNLLRAIKNPNALDRETAVEIAQKLGNITVTDTSDEIIKKMEGVSDAIKKGATETFESGIEGIDDVTVKRDVSGAFMKGRGADLGNDERFMAEGLRANIQSQAGGKIQDTLAQPSQQYENVLKQTKKAFGGDEAMEATGKAVKTDAQRQLDTAAQKLNTSQEVLEASQKELSPEKLIPEQEVLATKLEENLKKAKDTRNEAFNKVEGWASPEIIDDQLDTLKEGARDTTITKVEKILEEDFDGSYGSLHNKVKPRLSKLANQLSKNGEGGEAEIVNAFRQKITGDEQLEYLRKTGGNIKPVEEAQKATKDFGKVWNDGLGGEYNKNLKRTSPFQEKDRLAEGRSIIQKASKEGAISEQRDLRQMLGQDANDYLDGLTTRKINLDKAKKEFNEAQNIYKKEEKRILDGVLKNWRDSEGIDIPGSEALPKYFGTNGEVSVVKRLVDKAKADSPEALNGVKSAFADYLFENTRMSSQTSAGRVPLKGDALKDKKLMAMGDAIYGKDSTEWKLIQGVLKEALDIQNSSQAHKIPIAKLNKLEARTRGIVDVAVTQIWGHLSRIGSRVRSAARLAIPGSNEKIIQSYDKLASNAHLFADLLDKEIAARKGVLDKESFKKIYRLGALIGVYADNEEDENKFVKDFSTALQTEEMFK